MKTKDEIRDGIRSLRRACGECREESLKICRRIEAMPEFRNAHTILSYKPMKGEVDVSELDCSGKKVILTTCDWQDIPAEEIDFAIIPGVAFDKNGMRLGRGGGYYDRLIPLMHCPCAGVALEWQLFEELPSDPWDKPVDTVVMPDRIFRTEIK